MGGGTVAPGMWQHSVNAARVPIASTSLLGALGGVWGLVSQSEAWNSVPWQCEPSGLWSSGVTWPGLSSWHVHEAREGVGVSQVEGDSPNLKTPPPPTYHRWLPGAWPRLWCSRMTCALRATSRGVWRG